MSSEWRPPTGRHVGCGWERDDPEPHEHGVDCDEWACTWVETETCGRHPQVRIILADGRFFDVCNPEAHDVGSWVRSAQGRFLPWQTWPLVSHPRWQGTFDQHLAYFYRMEDLERLADLEHPLLRLVSR